MKTKTICGYDIADGDLCRETKLNAKGHCKTHAPEYEPQHTPTPPWKVIESLKGIGTIYGQCTQECLGTGKPHDHLEMVGEISIANAVFIVRAVNCHEDLIKTMQQVSEGLASTPHEPDKIEVYRRMLDKAIAKAEGK